MGSNEIILFPNERSPLYWANLTAKERIVVNQGGTYCFEGDQLVMTANGLVPIADVKVGDRVLSHNVATGQDEYRVVVATPRHKNEKKVVRVRLKNGQTITCTEDHKFFFDGRWVEIKHILSLLDARRMESNTGI